MVGEKDQIPKGILRPLHCTHVCIHTEAQTHTINKCQFTKHQCGLSHRKREFYSLEYNINMNLLSIPNPVYVMSPAKISFIYFFQVEKYIREKSRKILIFIEKEKITLCSIWNYIINIKNA